MKALTVQQPWAWAIMHGGKTIENRTQNWKYRGPLAIHAGNRWSDRGGQSDLVIDSWCQHSPIEALKSSPTQLREDDEGEYYRELDRMASTFPFGAIIGVVDLVDAHPEAGCCKPWGESAYVEHGGRERRQIVHLVLENPRPLAEPYPCSGALGLWPAPADLVVPA